jgi:Na+/proline symporter
MSSDSLAQIVAVLYWALILCWLVILLFYWREHRRLTALSSMVGTMLVVVFLDGRARCSKASTSAPGTRRAPE